MTSLRLPLVAALALAACADDDGTAPAIANLTAAPLTAAVGATTTINGTLAFTDPDGDLAAIAITVTLPDGTTQELPASPVQGVTTQTEGTVTWALLLMPPAAGRYDLAISLLDEADHASNALTTAITAQ